MNKLIACALVVAAIVLGCTKSDPPSPQSQSALLETKAGPSVKAAEVVPTPKPSSDPAFTVSKVTAQVKDALRGKGKYVRIDFKATTLIKPEKGVNITAQTSCKVGSDMMIEKSLVMGEFKGADVGQSKNLDFAEWPNNPLESAPSACTLTFGSGKLGDEPDMNMGSFCFTPPSDVKPGACPK